MVESGYNDGNSMMNDYEIENVPYQQLNMIEVGNTIKKSSVKRT